MTFYCFSGLLREIYSLEYFYCTCTIWGFYCFPFAFKNQSRVVKQKHKRTDLTVIYRIGGLNYDKTVDTKDG